MEVWLAGDSNDPDLGTRHVSVLLSSHVIDQVRLLSAAWIHSWALLHLYTAVTRHKEGSISTSSELSAPPPACAFKSPPSTSRWSGGGGGGPHETRGGRGTEGEIERVSRRQVLIVLRRGQGIDASVLPQDFVAGGFSATLTTAPLQQSMHNNLAETTRRHRGKKQFPALTMNAHT